MNRLEQILKETFNVNVSDYKDETEINQFKEWDSMAHMMLITRLEETFEIFIDGDEIAEMNTVGQIKNVLRKHKVLDI